MTTGPGRIPETREERLRSAYERGPAATELDRRNGETRSEMEADDGALIRESLDDAAVFGTIFDRHYDTLYRFVARRVGPATAADLAAETFTRAFAGRGRYKADRTSARPWLFGIALNLPRHHYRAETRQLRAYARTGVDPLVDATSELEYRADAKAEGPRLAAALAAFAAGGA